MLCCHQPLVQIDEAVFGADAKEFKPKRFMENPGLKKEVSLRGRVKKEKSFHVAEYSRYLHGGKLHPVRRAAASTSRPADKVV